MPALLPYWVCQKRRNEMLVTDQIRKLVVFIGHYGVRDPLAPDEDKFIPDGTGFVLMLEAYGFAFPYVVTAKHVIDQAAGKERDGAVVLRINGLDGDIKYIKTKFAAWQVHPEHSETGRKRKYVDVAVYGLVNYREWAKSDIKKYDFTYLMEEDICTDAIIQKYAIGLGDEVTIPGLFLSHIGTTKNVPIVRTGNIAAMREEPVPTDRGLMDAYLVEMRSVGGISGSPVLTHMAIRPKVLLPESDNSTNIEQSEKSHYLLGLMHGHYTITTRDEWVIRTDQQVGDINAGVAVVVPASKIIETILGSELFAKDQEMAKNFSDAANSTSGAVADSVPQASPPANDANPTHREDFMRLVGAATRKPEPKD